MANGLTPWRPVDWSPVSAKESAYAGDATPKLTKIKVRTPSASLYMPE